MSDAELYAGASGIKLSDFQRGYIKALYDFEVPVKKYCAAHENRAKKSILYDQKENMMAKSEVTIDLEKFLKYFHCRLTYL